MTPMQIMRTLVAVMVMAILEGRIGTAPPVIDAALHPHLAQDDSNVEVSRRPIIHVDDDAGPGGDGSGRFPFDNIADALARAASLGGAVVVVEPGQYPVSSTLRIQSAIDLVGSNVMEID